MRRTTDILPTRLPGAPQLKDRISLVWHAGTDRTAARPANRCLTELGMKLEPGFQIRSPTSPFRRPTSLCGQRLGRLGHANRTHLRQLSTLQSGQSEPASAGDEQVQHRPAEAQATGLAWEPADHFDAPLDLLWRPLQQVRR